MEDTSDKTTEYIDKMLTAPANIQNEQVELLKSIVLNLGQFDGNKTKFKNQWRGIILFLKSNRVTVTDDRIIAILANLRRNIAGIYTQKKLNELDEEINIYN